VGVAFVLAHRGGTELAQAEQIASKLLEHHRSWARAHFLMGLIHQKRGEAAAAAESYKTAAQLLLNRIGPVGPGEDRLPGP
jgi:Tfp pilus assembly protein PilF